MPTLDDAIALDRADPIAWLRDEFIIDATGPIYADGNSLGRVSRATHQALARLVDDEWGTGLIRSWDGWFDLPEAVGDLIATAFLGARSGEVIVADSTTVNFYKLAIAALRRQAPERDVVITDRANFPSDRFIVDALGANVVYVDDASTPGALETAINEHAGRVGLVTLAHVDYRSGFRHDLAAVTRAAHDAGGLVLWDLSHSVGAVEIDLDASGADLAVGCTYKYLNGGPGSPAFLYVRADLQDQLAQPIPGWFGAANQFRLSATYEPAAGIRRFLSGTPSVVGLRSVEAAVTTLALAGIRKLATKGARLAEFVIDLADELLAPAGFVVVTPRAPAERGAHVALQHPDAWRICRGLIEQAAVIPDFREPDVLRLGFAPAYTRFVDVYEASVRLHELVESGAHLALSNDRTKVT